MDTRGNIVGYSKKAPRKALEYVMRGGEGGIRTHVQDFSYHPISNRRRYGHFGTPPDSAA